MRDGPDHLLGLFVVFHVGVRGNADLHGEDLLHDAAGFLLAEGGVLGLVLLQQFPVEMAQFQETSCLTCYNSAFY